MVVGVGEEAGIDLGHAREELLLAVRQRVPRLAVVELRKGLSLRALAGRRGADRVDRWQLSVGRDDAHLLLTGQRLHPHRLVTRVEAPLVLVDPLLWCVVRCVAGARRVVEEERLVRRDHLGVLDELEGLVGDVLGEVVALLRRLRLVHGMVVVDQVRIPLVRLGPEEAVPALEAPAARPVTPRRSHVHLDGGAEVPLAHHVGVPAQLSQDLGDHAVLGRDHAAPVREADRALGDARHAVAAVVATGQQARPRRRAQRRGVPLGVAHAVVRDLVDVRRLDRSAIARHGREADVVEHDVDDVGRPVRSLGRRERRPVRRRITDVDVDDSSEWSRPCSITPSLLCAVLLVHPMKLRPVRRPSRNPASC